MTHSALLEEHLSLKNATFVFDVNQELGAISVRTDGSLVGLIHPVKCGLKGTLPYVVLHFDKEFRAE